MVKDLEAKAFKEREIRFVALEADEKKEARAA